MCIIHTKIVNELETWIVQLLSTPSLISTSLFQTVSRQKSEFEICHTVACIHFYYT